MHLILSKIGRYHDFREIGDTLMYTHVLLCRGSQMSGMEIMALIYKDVIASTGKYIDRGPYM